MDSKSIREAFMNRKVKVELIDISLPDLPQLDNQLYAMEISGEDMTYAKEKATNGNGVMDEQIANAAIIARSLISREEYDKHGKIERIFSDDDIDFIKKFGTKVQLILASRVNKVSGMTQDFLTQLGINSTPTPNTASASS